MLKKLPLLFAFIMLAFYISTKAQVNKAAQKVVMKDSALYSKKFIEELRNSPTNSFILKDSVMIVTGAHHEIDTVSFPGELPLHQTQFLVGSRHDTSFVLEVKRISYTTISYNLHVAQNRKPFDEYILDAGEANLNPLFFREAETMKDEKGVACKADVYTRDGRDCHLSISVGRNKQGIFITTFERSCKDDKNVMRSPVLKIKG